MLTTLIAALGIAAAAAPQTAAPAPVEVMVLGTYHFDNPGLDKVNVKVDDVLVPRRQRELQALAEAIAKFRPTHVMIEAQRQGPAYDVEQYRTFTPASLAASRNEIVQIGYRIAALAGLKSVQGIDEQPGPGEPDYFPFGPLQDYAEKHGEAGQIEAMVATLQGEAKQTEALQTAHSVPWLLQRYNDPASPLASNDFYYAALRFGDGEVQPGADLNAMWYLRNAKIFAKLVNVAKPGDRVLVVYGAGHGYWLRHFAATTPGFRSVDVIPYLKAADAALSSPAKAP